MTTPPRPPPIPCVSALPEPEPADTGDWRELPAETFARLLRDDCPHRATLIALLRRSA